jgi:thymidine phosphorylase
MKIKEITLKKENKKELGFEEIEFAIKNFLAKKISKSEMTDFLRAIYKNGMTEKETFSLTSIMTNSGKTLSFSDKNKVYADKHSTGGVSDSATLIIAPIIACAGIGFLKCQGANLGILANSDKLECFEGYKTNLSLEDAEKLVAKNGATLYRKQKISSCDKYIYKLRDETNTIMSIP